jgi:predicted DNA-binding helix-hairpin-helix protein
VELVRFKYRFSGYVHLKIIPGSEEAQIHRAMQLANRVSVNLEVPTATSLGRIAPHKNLDLELMSAIARVGSLLEEKKLRCRSQTTQFVVGASNENDREIMSALWRCYREMNLARGYFSAFQPVAGTPLADKPATSPRREHRLYQTDFLLRRYGFSFEDLFFDGDGNLPLSIDPKTIWASRHREIFPLEINNAPLKTLMRVPGIGPEAASALVNLRNREKIRTIEALKSAAPRWRIAAPYLLLDGRIAAPSPGRQLDLF